MKSIRVFALSSFLLIASNQSVWASSDEEPAGYLFMGSDLSAKQGKSHFPVVKVDKKNIYVDQGSKIRKVSISSPSRLTNNIVLSEDFVEVLELDYNFASMQSLEAQSRAVSDMFMMAAQTEYEVSRLEGALEADSGLSEAQRDEIRNDISRLEYDNDNVQENVQELIDSGHFDDVSQNDTLFMDIEILPTSDIADAYCVVEISFDPDPENAKDSVRRTSFVRTSYIGDLVAGRGERIRFSRKLAPFPDNNVQCKLHIYSNQKGEIATSLSRGLKSMTAKEVARYRELASKTQ